MLEYKNAAISPHELPQIGQLKYTSLDKNYAKLSILESFINWAIIWGISVVALNLQTEIEVTGWLWLMLTGLTLFSLIYRFFAAKYKGFVIRDKDILYREGIWWQTRTGVSFKRIQHIDISHGPIERLFGIASIKCYTAGGASADLKIPGLPNELAKSTREHILNQTEIINE
ncbi:PH domain-containing protein [Aliikangiella sp. IMCC44359]|uniref:PH domain-containing protein n=1 Tax=Aliikangiella sp. IMCC44359 TaxID=3459125 RepID=UPI00403A7FBE